LDNNMQFPPRFSAEDVSRLELMYGRIMQGRGTVQLSTLQQFQETLAVAAGGYSLDFQAEHEYWHKPGEEPQHDPFYKTNEQADAYLYREGDTLYLFTLYGCYKIMEDSGFADGTLRLGLAEWVGGTVRINLLDRKIGKKRSLICFYKTPDGPLVGEWGISPLDMAEFEWDYDEACEAWNARMEEQPDYGLKSESDLEAARAREKCPATYELIQRMNQLDLYLPGWKAEYEELMNQAEWLHVRLEQLSVILSRDRSVKRRLMAESNALESSRKTLRWRRECRMLDELLEEFPGKFVSGMKKTYWVNYFNAKKKNEQWKYEHNPDEEFVCNLSNLGLPESQLTGTDLLSFRLELPKRQITTDWLSVSPSWTSCFIVAGSKLVYLDSEECVSLMEDAGFKDGSLHLKGEVLWDTGTRLLTLADTKNDRVRKLLCICENGWKVTEVSPPPFETY